MPKSNVILCAGMREGDPEPFLACKVCGAKMTIGATDAGPMRMGRWMVATILAAALPHFSRDHRECAPDRIGPDDEAWLREALK